MRFNILAIVSNALPLVIAQSLDEVLSSQASFSILHGVLRQHDLFDVLGSSPNSTFLAMTDRALVGLAEFGINLTTADPMIARAIMFYALLDGVYTNQTVDTDGNPQVVHSMLRPPLFTNVTKGAAAKVSCIGNPRFGCSLIIETGLGARTPTINPSLVFDNGVIHAIDSNMVLPHNISETGRLEKLSGFADLITKADLLNTIDSLADTTIFMPEDDAVNAMAPVLIRLSLEELASVVTQHAVPNSVLYQHQIGESELSLGTLGGGTVRLRRGSDRNIYVNDKQVVRPDVLIYGGVVHTIDGLLLPDGLTTFQGGKSSLKLSAWTLTPHSVIQSILYLAMVIALCLCVVVAKNRRRQRKAAKAKAVFEKDEYRLIVAEKA